MNLQTFKAATMAEALQQVKTVMGHDAVILHTRTYQLRQWLGLKRREMVEITAGRGLQVARKPRPAVAPLATSGLSSSAIPGTYGPGFTKSSILPSAQPTIQTLAQSSKQLLDTPAAGNAMMLGITQEVSQLKLMVKDILKEQRHAQSPNVCEELFDYYLTLIQNQVTDELAQEIIASLKRDLRPEYLSQPAYIRERLGRLSRKADSDGLPDHP